MAEQFAIVTGASSGIGLSLAKDLAGRSYDLALCSAGERLQTAAEELRSRGTEVTEIQADLQDLHPVAVTLRAEDSLAALRPVECQNLPQSS
jgi:uncharacterized protein